MKARTCRDLGTGLTLGVGAMFVIMKITSKYGEVTRWASEWWYSCGRTAAITDLANGLAPDSETSELHIERLLQSSVKQQAARRLALSHYTVVRCEAAVRSVRTDKIRNTLQYLLDSWLLDHVKNMRDEAEQTLYASSTRGKTRQSFERNFTRRFMSATTIHC